MSDEGRLHVVHSGRDGVLASTTEADLHEMFARLASVDKIVVHFHGGLVDQDAGFRIAGNLAPVYREAGAYPVFFVWSSGVTEIVRSNLREILDEAVFKRILAWALRFAYGKIRQDEGSRDIGALPAPSLRDVRRELGGLEAGREPYAQVGPVAEVSELSERELAQVEIEVAADPTLASQLAAVAAGPTAATAGGGSPGGGPTTGGDAAGDDGSRGVGPAPAAPATTLMSPDVLDELVDRPDGTRSIVSTAALARKVGQVVVAVVRRYRGGSDHGLYCTVVEEVLRSFYLANLGGALWQAIKRETEDTFQDASPPRAGKLFLDGLERILADGPRPRVTLVGHSTGAIFIENLVDELRRRRADPGSPVPSDFRFANIVYLAPASLFPHGWELLGHWEEVAENFRLFAMTDEAEQADHVVPGYPRSLLYLVSGIAERDGDRSAWMPILGQARYYVDRAGQPLSGDGFESLPGIRDVRRFVVGDATLRRTVWSPTPADAPPGFRAGARKHGAFDDDPAVHESLQHLIRG